MWNNIPKCGTTYVEQAQQKNERKKKNTEIPRTERIWNQCVAINCTSQKFYCCFSHLCSRRFRSTYLSAVVPTASVCNTCIINKRLNGFIIIIINIGRSNDVCEYSTAIIIAGPAYLYEHDVASLDGNNFGVWWIAIGPRPMLFMIHFP